MPVFRSPTCASSEDAERCLHLSLKQDHVPVFHSPSWASSEDAERDYDGSSLSLTSAPTKSLHVDSDDDDSEGIEESEAVSTAQYVKGIVGMARGVLKKMPAVRKIHRYGVFLIDIRCVCLHVILVLIIIHFLMIDKSRYGEVYYIFLPRQIFAAR